MKERLIQLLDLEQISPSKFADIIGVQRSSVSHILSGRNKPSFDFLQKTLKAFPGLKADWLIQGEGTMYAHMGQDRPAGLFDNPDAVIEPETPLAPEAPEAPVTRETEINVQAEPGPEESPQDPAAPKKVVQVIVVYDDDTFTSYTPSV